MKVKEHLTSLHQKIFDACIPMPATPATDDYKEKVKRSIIADIHQRLAEIVAIIERETSDESLNVSFSDASKTFPDRLNSILNLISVLALSIKTKLNINEIEKFSDAALLQKLDTVCFDCFNIAASLQNKQDPEAIERYKNGIITSVKYQDYKTGFGKTLMPGIIKGQIMATSMGAASIVAEYMRAVVVARTKLDGTYKPSPLQSESLYSSSPEMAAKADTLFKGVFAPANQTQTSGQSATSTARPKQETTYCGMKKGFLN